MPKYSVAFQIYASTYIIVEAENEEAAKDKARDVIEDDRRLRVVK